MTVFGNSIRPGVYKCDLGGEALVEVSNKAVTALWYGRFYCPGTRESVRIRQKFRVPFDRSQPVTQSMYSEEHGTKAIEADSNRGISADSPRAITVVAHKSDLECFSLYYPSSGRREFKYWKWDSWTYTDEIYEFSCIYNRPSDGEFERPEMDN